jgi:hypothetical protein
VAISTTRSIDKQVASKAHEAIRRTLPTGVIAIEQDAGHVEMTLDEFLLHF